MSVHKITTGNEPKTFNENPRNVEIAVACCTLDRISSDFILDFIKLITSGAVKHHFFVQSSLLPVCRNLAVKAFFRHCPNATHLLMIDDDMAGFSPAHVYRLASHNVDVVAPLMTRKKYPFTPACQPITRQAKTLLEELTKSPDDMSLIECDHVGTGMILIKREVLEKIKEDNEFDIWFTSDRMIDYPRAKQLAKEFLNEKKTDINHDDLIDFANNFRRKFDLSGEDVDFCFRCNAAGIKVYVDPACQIMHLGPTGYHIGHHIQSLQQGASNKNVENSEDERSKRFKLVDTRGQPINS